MWPKDRYIRAMRRCVWFHWFMHWGKTFRLLRFVTRPQVVWKMHSLRTFLFFERWSDFCELQASEADGPLAMSRAMSKSHKAHSTMAGTRDGRYYKYQTTTGNNSPSTQV